MNKVVIEQAEAGLSVIKELGSSSRASNFNFETRLVKSSLKNN